MPKGKGSKTRSGTKSTNTKTAPPPSTNPLLNNTTVNNLVTGAKNTMTTVEDTTTTGIDKVKGVVDHHTHSRRKDETIHAKGGTVEGFEQAESMATIDPQVDAENRFSELEDLLFRKDAKGGPKLRTGTLDLFNKITPRLAGGGVLKDMDHDLVCGTPLTTALRRCFSGFNRHTGSYLVDMLRNDGVPSHAMQILDAMGLVSVPQKDEKNYEAVIKGICKGITPSEAITAKRTLRAKGVTDDQIPSQIKSASQLGKKAAKIKGGDTGALNDWLTGWDQKLADAVKAEHEKNKNSFSKLTSGKAMLEDKKIKKIVVVVRKTLGKLIADEIEFDMVGKVRKQLKKDHSVFEAALGQIKYVDDQLRSRLIAAVTTPDKTKLLVARTDAPSKYETSEEKDIRERDERKEDAKNLASVSVARAMLGDGGFTPEELKTKGGLTGFIEKMTPEARQMLVASHLVPKKRQTFLTPSTPVARLNALFDEAWEGGGLRQSVEDALFTQEKLDKIDKSKQEKETTEEQDQVAHLKTKVVRIHSLLRFSGDAGPNYMALVDLAEDEILSRVSTTTYGTRIWETAQRMKGAELYQIRNDVPLLLRLRKLVKRDLTRPSITNWDKFVTMMKLPDNLKLRDNDKTDPATLESVLIKNRDAQGKRLGKKTTLGQAYEAVADNLEFTPDFWVMHLHRLVKMITPSHSDTYSVVTRAQIAGKRWAAQENTRREKEHAEQVEAAEQSNDPAPPQPTKATEAEFMRNIWDAMSDDDRTSVEKKIPNAYAALANGVHLTTDTRLERASGWKIGGSQTSLNTNKTGVVSAFEDLSGRELLEEWSNVAELRAMHEERMPLIEELVQLDEKDVDDQVRISELETQLGALGDRMARYWPSINRAKLKYLEDNLAGGTRTEVQGMLAAKLAGAMRGDSEFKQSAREAGLSADDYDAERLVFGHMMNKRRQLDTGLQYGTNNKMQAILSLRSMVTNPMNLQSFGQNEGNEHINKGASQARKAQSNIYLAQVRNTQAQLGKVRNDNTLTDDERKEKTEHLREVGAKQIEETREELDTRNKAFVKARKQMTAAITRVLQVLFLIAVSAATFGQGTVAVIVSMILSGIAREAAGALAKWAMEGDAFEHKDLAKAIAIGAVKGALRAATAELLTLMDATSTLVDFGPDTLNGLAPNLAYGELVMNTSIEAAMRSAIVDIPVNTMKYMLNTERPFRDFGRNLDVFIVTNATGVIGRQVGGIIGALANQGSQDLDNLFTTATGPPPSGGVVEDAMGTFQTTAQTQVTGLVGRLALVGKKAKIAMKLAAKKLWGKYPETWRKLANESAQAVAERKELEGVVDVNQLPNQAEIDRVMALLDEITEGKKDLSDLSDKDRVSIGTIIKYLQSQGVGLP